MSSSVKLCAYIFLCSEAQISSKVAMSKTHFGDIKLSKATHKRNIILEEVKIWAEACATAFIDKLLCSENKFRSLAHTHTQWMRV